ncbi:alcohol dehydrogenase catalytic domain-containing protein [Sulfolobus sp. E5-1-F]|uniref:zinc-dependent alcohol dehydrogenase family protein n=1 Tax=Saccharolobus sp. E5-1-F TaxID=2663019 RepID=UPI0012967B22|nr:zinc-dependent alcohol dehydrogenase family protein [Sulfolobus sp. E5-1-F]QGA53722.1 alcohol dehydrogenase catalytic domain-containing protein [Sulfolobus sp. E5-1-F]
MKAARLVEFQKPLKVEDLDVPKVGKGDVLLKVISCGICRSDWHLWRGDPALVAYMQWSGGKLPITQGHEVYGEVVEVGESVSRLKKGDRVVMPASSTGDNRTCKYCMEGNSNVCEHLVIAGYGIDGCFAEYMLVPERSVVDLVKVPDGIKAEWAALTSCGFATSWNAFTVKSNLKPGETVVIIGAGGMGLSGISIANALGAKVIAVDINERSLEKAKMLGSIETYRYSGKSEELNKIAEDIMKKYGSVDVVYDTTGIPEAITPFLSLIRPQGTLLLAGLMMKGKEVFPLPADLVVAREIRIQGVLMLPAQKFDAIFNLMKEGRINLDPVIYKTISVDEINDAYKEMSEYKNAGRIIINKFS